MQSLEVKEKFQFDLLGLLHLNPNSYMSMIRNCELDEIIPDSIQPNGQKFLWSWNCPHCSGHCQTKKTGRGVFINWGFVWCRGQWLQGTKLKVQNHKRLATLWLTNSQSSGFQHHGCFPLRFYPALFELTLQHSWQEFITFFSRLHLLWGSQKYTLLCSNQTSVMLNFFQNQSESWKQSRYFWEQKRAACIECCLKCSTNKAPL